MSGSKRIRHGLGYGQSFRQENGPQETIQPERIAPSHDSTTLATPTSLTKAKLAIPEPSPSLERSTLLPSSLSKQRQFQKKAQLLLDQTASSLDTSSRWERSDMLQVAEKLKADEAQMGFLNPDTDTALATISRIKDEKSETIYDHAESVDRFIGSEKKRARVENELTHHDAMFTAGHFEIYPQVAQQASSSQHSTSSSSLLSSVGKKFERPRSPGGGGEMPLYKRLQVGHEVKARFTGDGCWHAATIKQVTHGGFPNAMFTVVYTDYGTEEALSWRDINFDGSGGSDDQVSAPCSEHDSREAVSTETPTPKDSVPLNPGVMKHVLGSKKGGWRTKARRK